MLIRNSDIIKELSKQKNIPVEQLHTIFVDFYHHLKMHLHNPNPNFTKGIKIKSCFKFRVNPKAVLKTYINSIKANSTTLFALDVYSYYDLLNEKNELTKRQKELGQGYQRPDIQTKEQHCQNGNQDVI